MKSRNKVIIIIASVIILAAAGLLLYKFVLKKEKPVPMEKTLVGYVNFLDSNLYFDRDGLVKESTAQIYEGVPEITGLDIDYVVLDKTLPVSSKTVLNQLLQIVQYLSDTEVTWGESQQSLINIVAKIHFDTGRNILLSIGDIGVNLGSGDYLEGKLHELSDILPGLYGLSGTLHLETYSDSDSGHTYTFK